MLLNFIKVSIDTLPAYKYLYILLQYSDFFDVITQGVHIIIYEKEILF